MVTTYRSQTCLLLLLPCLLSLMLIVAHAFTNCYRPGGKLKPGESDIDGLKRKLNNKLAAPESEYQPAWEIGDLVSVWWRPAFEAVHVRKFSRCVVEQYPTMYQSSCSNID